jgi:NADH:ubiquinone oxidoreductase subunit 5 (subunit L)/multisubunit Na+/H+ antiporter MnhA subunit
MVEGSLVKYLVVVSLFTSFYAGLNSLFEVDLKKLIALSTLSHLGFIRLALFSGLVGLAFFHLLVHALFKSLLFMAIGDIMIRQSHCQDVRLLSSGLITTPASSLTMLSSLFNLLGLPAMRGFFSKDLVLESLNLPSGGFNSFQVPAISQVFDSS